MRPGRSSKLISALAVLGLILISTFMVVLLNSTLLVETVPQRSNGNTNSSSGAEGGLLVQLFTNENESNVLGSPTSQVVPLGNKTMVVTQDINSSKAISNVLVTDFRGVVVTGEPPGPYLVKINDRTLNISIPIVITVGNVTNLEVTIYGAAFPLVYSEESGALTAEGVQSSMYVEVQTFTPVANVSEPVILDVNGAAPGTGHQVNATVVAGQPPAQGTQWLELGTAGTVDTVDASSIVLTTWSYTSNIVILPIGSNVGAFFG